LPVKVTVNGIFPDVGYPVKDISGAFNVLMYKGYVALSCPNELIAVRVTLNSPTELYSWVGF